MLDPLFFDPEKIVKAAVKISTSFVGKYAG
jgi:hypothetical protein